MTSHGGAWQPGYPVDLRGEVVARRAAQGAYGDVEYAGARILARATGERVVLQDDNGADRIPDIRIEHEDGRLGLGEVVSVVDEARAAELAAFRDGGLDLFSDDLRWQWWITAPATVRRAGLRQPLLGVLAEMEKLGERPPMLAPIDPATAGRGAQQLLQLGVTQVSANSEPGDRGGCVHWQPEGIGGHRDVDLEQFRGWLDGFLDGPMAKQKMGKLLVVQGHMDRHLLAGVSWSAPWPVVRLLDGDVGVLPVQDPHLPRGISHLWLWGCEMSDRALAWWPERGWFDVANRWVTS